MRENSDRINDLFAVSSRDLTPASARHAASVLYAPISLDPEVSRLCVSVLSDTELQKADRFANQDDKAQFIQRRAFRRFCGATVLESSQPLSQIVFEETEKGRPYLAGLPDLWFSFSSCRFGFIGVWSSTHGIGADIEDQTRNLEVAELARHYFSESEASAIEEINSQERQQAFFQTWSLKEAALKSIGEGLPFGLDTFEFELHPSPRLVRAPLGHGGPELYNAHIIEGTDGCAALVIRILA